MLTMTKVTRSPHLQHSRDTNNQEKLFIRQFSLIYLLPVHHQPQGRPGGGGGGAGGGGQTGPQKVCGGSVVKPSRQHVRCGMLPTK